MCDEIKQAEMPVSGGGQQPARRSNVNKALYKYKEIFIFTRPCI
jgi:hypothetical protein